MLTIDALKAYGANTRAGLDRCLGSESFYLGLVEMLICDEKFDILQAAVAERDVSACLHVAYALSDTAESLGLTPLSQQLEQMVLCLQLQGDGAVLDKQLALVERGLDVLKDIQGK
ncbi:MAG: Hpt domain-containing protein [Clostridia bacterium]|nr:Hpt domain-containing protein [Clostridia bacterium]